MRVRRSSASGRHRATLRAGAGVPRGLLVAALVLVLVPLAAGVALALTSTGEGAQRTRPEATARAVVEDWDERRAAAYAAGDVAAVRRLYPAGSALGEEDADVLAAYVERGLTVHDLRFEVADLAVEVDEPERVVVVVRDRMARAEVRRGDGTPVARLPARGEAERRLVLERRGDTWVLVAAEHPGARDPTAPDAPVTPSVPAPP